MTAASSLKAILGPTNTGKTFYAIERMLAHRSGMIGLPLRLLAREVYGRVAERVGKDAVALVTGEERIVPPKARYWVCTVEAMPLDMPVECVAVDEIQVATDFDRGHVFTDRILKARGLSETLLLGATTMTPLIRECRSQDTIIVPINPVERPGTPRTARDILNRLNEISFNAVLLKELRMMAMLRRVAPR